MEYHYTPLLLASVLCIVCDRAAHAQCAPLATAVDGPVMVASSGIGGTNNRSGIAYDPVAGLYYSVNAGNAAFPVDTYDASFDLIDSIAQGYDYRGAWWNPNTAQFEGNGFGGSGIFAQTLDGAAHPTGGGTVVLASGQPEAQACGAYDPDANEIVYYYNGSIYRYDRATGFLINIITITGLPVTISSLNTSSIGYTGCPGHEYVVYDYVDRQVLFFSKPSMTYTASCQLPPTATARDFLGMAYAHDIFWLFDNVDWQGYEVLSSDVGIATPDATSHFTIAPNPTADDLWITVDPIEGATLDLIDATGRTVRVVPMNNAGKVHVDLADLREGSYIARLRSDEHAMVRSFVIAR